MSDKVNPGKLKVAFRADWESCIALRVQMGTTLRLGACTTANAFSIVSLTGAMNINAACKKSGNRQSNIRTESFAKQAKHLSEEEGAPEQAHSKTPTHDEAVRDGVPQSHCGLIFWLTECARDASAQQRVLASRLSAAV